MNGHGICSGKRAAHGGRPGRKRPCGAAIGVVLACLALLGTAPAQPPPVVAQPDSLVNFSFDEVDIRAFVKLVGDMTGRTIIVDDAVKGKVTVVTPQIKSRDVYSLFIKILESVGCAAVEEGSVTRVVTFGGRANAGAALMGAGAPGLGLVTKVIRLRYTSVSELRKVLDSLAGREKNPAIGALDTGNFLVVTDTADNIRRLEQIIAEVDQPGAGTVYEVMHLQYIDAKEVAEQLAPILPRADRPRETVGLPSQGRYARDVNIVASPHSNSVILIGDAQDVAELKKMIALLDVESPSGNGTLHAVFLKYLSADEAAKSLNALLSKPAAADKGKPAGSVLERRIAVEPSLANNALLVDASTRDFEVVHNLITDLDQPSEQVLIEVVIAEMTLTDESDLGVELAFLQSPAKVGDVVVQGGSRLSDSSGSSLMSSIQNGLFPQGITIGVSHGSHLDSSGKLVSDTPFAANINAVDKKGKYKILSSVPLLAQNNKEASVNVVENIPVLKSTIQGGSGTARDVIQNIDRVDVGIKLKLTPHVNPDGDVTMVLNPSIEAVLNPLTSGTDLTPTIAKREVSTTVTVPNGRTIVISGLIRDNRTKTISRTPILGYLPLIGWLFRQSIDKVERTNLLVFVTPKVTTNPQDAQASTAELQERTGISPTNIMEREAR